LTTGYTLKLKALASTQKTRRVLSSCFNLMVIHPSFDLQAFVDACFFLSVKYFVGGASLWRVSALRAIGE